MKKTLILFLACFSIHFTSVAQDCACLTTEVMDNTVTACDIIVGTVTTVSTTSELKNAINEANNSGGDMTILIEDGTYPIASTAQYPYITASNVVFRSASGNRDAVIITGQGMTEVAPGTEIGFYAVGDNITIADLTIRDLGNHGIAVTGDHLFVHNVRFQDTYEQMVKGNSAGNGADFGTVQCSLFEYTAGIGPQWYIGGLDIHQGDDWVVSDNVFYDIASPSQALAEHAVHFWDSSANNTVERNIIVGCDRGIGFGLGSSPNSGGIIRNNMIYNDGSTPFHDVGISLETSPGTKVYNNSVMIQYQNAIEYRFAETVDAHIVNNVCNQAITSRNGGQALLETNVVNAASSWFVEPTAGNLRLQSALPMLVDQGSELESDVLDDIDKDLRPFNAATDIGAQEYATPNAIHEEELLSFQFFPNPAKDYIELRPVIDGPVKIHVLDLQGRSVMEVATTQVSRLDVSELAPGSYLIYLSYSGSHAIEKLVIQRP